MHIKAHYIIRDGGTSLFKTDSGDFYVLKKAGRPDLHGSIWKGDYPDSKAKNAIKLTEGSELLEFINALTAFPNISTTDLESLLTSIHQYGVKEKAVREKTISHVWSISSEDLKEENSRKEYFTEAEITKAVLRRKKEVEALPYTLKDDAKYSLDLFTLVWKEGPLHASRIPDFISKHLQAIRAEEDPEYSEYLRLKEKFAGR